MNLNSIDDASVTNVKRMADEWKNDTFEDPSTSLPKHKCGSKERRRDQNKYCCFHYFSEEEPSHGNNDDQETRQNFVQNARHPFRIRECVSER